MSRIDFDGIHSVKAIGDRFLITAVKGNQRFEFTLDQVTAAMLFIGLNEAAKELPDNISNALTVQGIQPIIGSKMDAGIALHLGGNWNLALSLSPDILEEFSNCISNLKAKTSFDTSKPQ